MAQLDSLMFQFGIVMLIAFIAAALAIRMRLSVIIGYLFAGMLIGPHMSLSLLGLEYRGFITDPEFVNELSQLGLILLLFFVGLGFPVAKLKRTKGAAAILAIIDVGVNMFAGFVLGNYLGWPLIDAVFLAGVISMSSSAVTAKSLMEFKRLSSSETQFLLGMVILESFMAMFLLTAVNGLVISSDARPSSLPYLALGIVIFIGFFAFLAAFVVPRIADLFHRIKNDELFILCALGIVFLSAALAEVFFVPAIIGAFFLGMSFADTKLSERLANKMESLRDAFVALFFLSFGMTIDPAAFSKVAGMVIMAVPLILVNELFLMAVLAYFIGFSGKAAVTIGASLVARNEESILYASVGTKAIRSNPSLSQEFGGELLSPFAGIICIVMSSLAPLLMKISQSIAAFLHRILPKYASFGGEVVRRTLRSMVLPSSVPLQKVSRSLAISLMGFVVYVLALTLTDGVAHAILIFTMPLVMYMVWKALKVSLEQPHLHANLSIEGIFAERAFVESFVLRIVVGALTVIALVAAAWEYLWQATIAILVAYLVFTLWTMKGMYNRIVLGFVRFDHAREQWRSRALHEKWSRRSRVYHDRGEILYPLQRK